MTAANSSSISDGAAALVLMRDREAEARGLKPLAESSAHATHAQAPGLVHHRARRRDQKLLDKAGWTTRTSISSRSTRPSRW